MCFSNPDSCGWHHVNSGKTKYFSLFLLHPLSLPVTVFVLHLHFQYPFVFIQIFLFLPRLSFCLQSALRFLPLTEKAVTTKRLFVKEATEPSFAQLFGDLCCQFVSVSLWGSCLCVRLSPARCAGYKPRQRLKPQIPFSIIHIAVIIVFFEVFFPADNRCQCPAWVSRSYSHYLWSKTCVCVGNTMFVSVLRSKHSLHQDIKCVSLYFHSIFPSDLRRWIVSCRGDENVYKIPASPVHQLCSWLNLFQVAWIYFDFSFCPFFQQNFNYYYLAVFKKDCVFLTGSLSAVTGEELKV